MKIFYFNTLLFIFSSLAFSACSSTSSTVDTTDPLLSFELYYSRASINGAEFEQFKLSDNSLFFECGTIRGGRYFASEQELTSVSPELLSNLNGKANAIVKLLSMSKTELPASGSSKHLADPGEFKLLLNHKTSEHSITTAFDPIAEPSSLIERRVNEFTLLVRSVAKEGLCGNLSFFGLSARRQNHVF